MPRGQNRERVSTKGYHCLHSHQLDSISAEHRLLSSELTDDATSQAHPRLQWSQRRWRRNLPTRLPPLPHPSYSSIRLLLLLLLILVLLFSSSSPTYGSFNTPSHASPLFPLHSPSQPSTLHPPLFRISPRLLHHVLILHSPLLFLLSLQYQFVHFSISLFFQSLSSLPAQSHYRPLSSIPHLPRNLLILPHPPTSPHPSLIFLSSILVPSSMSSMFYSSSAYCSSSCYRSHHPHHRFPLPPHYYPPSSVLLSSVLSHCLYGGPFICLDFSICPSVSLFVSVSACPPG